MQYVNNRDKSFCHKAYAVYTVNLYCHKAYAVYTVNMYCQQGKGKPTKVSCLKHMLYTVNHCIQLQGKPYISQQFIRLQLYKICLFIALDGSFYMFHWDTSNLDMVVQY